MRIDKFLKLSRVIKRRSVAKEACDSGRVKINDKIAKAKDEVQVTDIIEITFGNRIEKIKVLEVKEIVGKDDATSLYEIVQ